MLIFITYIQLFLCITHYLIVDICYIFHNIAVKEIAPSSDVLNMHLLSAAHNARLEWVECLHNVSVLDPSACGYVLKDDMFVRK